METSRFAKNLGLLTGALAIERPLYTLQSRIAGCLCSNSKYSYKPRELLSPFLRSIQALVWSVFTGSFSMHVKLYGVLKNRNMKRDCFYHTHDGVKAEPINEKYDRSFEFLNPNWEEIRKRYIGHKQFTTTQEFTDYVIKSISLFLSTATKNKCRTNLIGIGLTPLFRYFSKQDSTASQKRSFIGKLPEPTDSFSCTELQTRAFLFAGVDLFPNRNPKGIYPTDFYKTKCFTLLQP